MKECYGGCYGECYGQWRGFLYVREYMVCVYMCVTGTKKVVIGSSVS